MWTKTSDGSFIATDGRVVFVSAERFEKEICLGGGCFICGAARSAKPFNDEHIIPEWILRRFDLFGKKITLPNERPIPYGQYKLPCCESCNTSLGRLIEAPISEAFRGGHAGLAAYVEAQGSHLLFLWMGLLLLKTHLRFHADSRKGSQRIGELYDWAELHHLHTLVRAPYSRARIAPEAYGSLLIVPINGAPDEFDYGDLYVPQVNFVQLGDVAVIAVMNDSHAVLSNLYGWIERLTGRLSNVQLRELMVHFATVNMALKERPRFATLADMGKEKVEIVAFRSEYVELGEIDYEQRNQMMLHAMRPRLSQLRVAGHTSEQIIEKIEAGGVTFLFDDDGRFSQSQFIDEPEGNKS
jgi:hypothetical protein